MPVVSIHLKRGSAIWLTKELPDESERKISRSFHGRKENELLYENETTNGWISVIRDLRSGDLVTTDLRRRSAKGLIDVIVNQLDANEIEIMVNDPRPPGPSKISFRIVDR